MPAEDIRHPEKQPKSSKGGRKKYKRQKKKRQKREGRSSVPGRESYKERSFQTPGNLLTAESVPSFGSTEGNITGRKK